MHSREGFAINGLLKLGTAAFLLLSALQKQMAQKSNSNVA
jgi:hypothetical protein